MTDLTTSSGPIGRLAATTVDAIRAICFFAIVLVTALVVTTTFITVADPIVAASHALPDPHASSAVDNDTGDALLP
ncbi:hypothetical protein [uncultured Alsobacter sp.]|uniref:hypothetical protein n=1 Tax=uncultured Alsobacter sp. TaxID=1748258 RepID=UPI0025D97665|nr:hypothetical protein [uncultured Alsobacter sp.]